MKNLINGKKSPFLDRFDFKDLFYHWTIILMISYTVRAIIALSRGQEFINLL